MQNIAEQINGVELRIVNYGDGDYKNTAKPTENEIESVAAGYPRIKKKT